MQYENNTVAILDGYELWAYHRYKRRDEVLYFKTLVELAYATAARANDWDYFNLRAFSARTKSLSVAALVAWGERMPSRWRQYRFRSMCRSDGYVSRQGPVPGLRKRRGGRGYSHLMRTMSARRQAALVVAEDGEVAPRAARNASNIPSSWDDFARRRHLDHCWKSQRKGRKAWDR
jgi:hypothetical protein